MKSKLITRTAIHRMGYKKIAENRYIKRRRVRKFVRDEIGSRLYVTIGLERVHKFRWDVFAREGRTLHNSQAETIRHLKDWEKFAIA